MIHSPDRCDEMLGIAAQPKGYTLFNIQLILNIL
jgi:hypothetical protein